MADWAIVFSMTGMMVIGIVFGYLGGLARSGGLPAQVVALDANNRELQRRIRTLRQKLEDADDRASALEERISEYPTLRRVKVAP